MKTVLVVDDEFGVAEAVSVTLADEGYRVFVAANGSQGLAMLHDIKPDIVIVDYMMPIMNGAQMIQAMRADRDYSSIPVIIMSSVEESALRHHVQDYQSFLRKPFSLDALLEAVRQSSPS